MTHVLHWIVYVVSALLGWVGLVLAVGTVVHGRTWVWTRANGTSVPLVCSVRRRRSARPRMSSPWTRTPASRS